MRDRDAMSGQIAFQPIQAQAFSPSSKFQDRDQKSELFMRLGLNNRGKLGHSREKPWAGHLEGEIGLRVVMTLGNPRGLRISASHNSWAHPS